VFLGKISVYENCQQTKNFIRKLRKKNTKIGEEKIKTGYCLDDKISSGRINKDLEATKELKKPTDSIVHNFGFSDTFGVLDFENGLEHPCTGYYLSSSACELGVISSEVRPL
jgi:glycerol kinase